MLYIKDTKQALCSLPASPRCPFSQLGAERNTSHYIFRCFQISTYLKLSFFYFFLFFFPSARFKTIYFGCNKSLLFLCVAECFSLLCIGIFCAPFSFFLKFKPMTGSVMLRCFTISLTLRLRSSGSEKQMWREEQYVP